MVQLRSCPVLEYMATNQPRRRRILSLFRYAPTDDAFAGKAGWLAGWVILNFQGGYLYSIG